MYVCPTTGRDARLDGSLDFSSTRKRLKKEGKKRKLHWSSRRADRPFLATGQLQKRCPHITASWSFLQSASICHCAFIAHYCPHTNNGNRGLS